MNKTLFTSLFAVLFFTAFVSESYAQDRRGNRGSSSTRQGNTSRSTTTRPNRATTSPNRTTTRPNRSTTSTPSRTGMRNEARQRNRAQTGSTTTHHNPRNGGSTRHNPRHNGGSYNTNPPRGTSVYAGSRYNPRNDNRHYGTGGYYTPYNYNYRPYSPYRHSVRRDILRHQNRYQRTGLYYSWLRNYNSNYIYRNWLMYPTNFNNGYYVNNNYPYYVYNGYQHRYSSYDTCDYQLVDSYSDQVIQTFYNQTCNTGYDSCSYTRDDMNQRDYTDRYFCAETYNNGYGY